jgi:hypothetical protein
MGAARCQVPGTIAACESRALTRFIAPVLIDVYAEGQIDQEEMAWFLCQNVFVSMHGLGTGEGPDESVVLPMVKWDKLKMSGSGQKPD